MTYIIKVAETQSWTTWYGVEAESAEEAEDLFKIGHAEIVDEEFNSVDDQEILEIEPYHET